MKEINEHIKLQTKVYSIEHGVGKVIGVCRLYDGVDDYFEVSFSNDDPNQFYSLRNMTELRFSADADRLLNNLETLSLNISHNKRLNNISSQRVGEVKDLEYIVSSISSLFSIIEPSTEEKVMLSDYIGSLELEVSHVFKIPLSNARGMVSDYMKAA